MTFANTILFACVFLCTVTIVHSQEPAKYGSVSKEELLMKNYPADTTAAAIILFNKAERRDGNKIILSHKFKLDQTLFAAADYPAIRDFFTVVGDKARTSLVLRKK